MVQLLKKHTKLFDSTCDVQISARAITAGSNESIKRTADSSENVTRTTDRKSISKTAGSNESIKKNCILSIAVHC